MPINLLPRGGKVGIVALHRSAHYSFRSIDIATAADTSAARAMA
jgi:hypothetical protein